jgi:hypothetical protein
MKMTLRPILLSFVLLALVANEPSFAKEAHGQHGSRARTANANANTKAANPAQSRANGLMSAEPTIAPPVLPQGATPRGNRTVNPNVKIAPPGNAAHGQAAGTLTPAVRNAIGQLVVAPKNLIGSEAHMSSGLQAHGAVPPPSLHAAPAVAPPVVSFKPARANAPAVNVANANRGSGNGTALTRSAATPAAIGGATRPNYGINGTTVQTRR